MKEKVWVMQPEGFEEPGKEKLALPLLKALYRMKQGGYEWRETLFNFMIDELGWYCSNYDRAVYFKSWNKENWAIVGFWVDDATSVGTEAKLLELEEAFKRKFGISSNGEASWILSTSIRHNAESKEIFISQKEYIECIAKKFQVENAKPIASPLPLGIDFSAITRPETDEEKGELSELPYRELIGSLMFAAIVT
jgi:hypothetical protein